MISLQEPYQKRPIRFLELWEEMGWKIKIYGIAYKHPQPRAELVAAAKDTARTLMGESQPHHHYHAGFLGVHDGRGSNFIFFDYWADENELHHQVWVSPSGEPFRLENTTASGLIACVWDMRVMCFERQAWVDMVLANPHGPDIEKYLATRLNEDT